MQNGQTSELRFVALIVWYHRRLNGREAWSAAMHSQTEQLRRVERCRAELLKIVGERDDISFRINGGCVEAEVEDLRFVAFEIPSANKHGVLTLVTLLGRCPVCCLETISEPIFNLAGLGERLEKFEPINHPCYKPKQI